MDGDGPIQNYKFTLYSYLLFIYSSEEWNQRIYRRTICVKIDHSCWKSSFNYNRPVIWLQKHKSIYKSLFSLIRIRNSIILFVIINILFSFICFRAIMQFYGRKLALNWLLALFPIISSSLLANQTPFSSSFIQKSWPLDYLLLWRCKLPIPHL